MAKIAFHLPGGRGVLQGQNAAILQAEQVRNRADEIPKLDAPFWTSMPPTVTITTITPIANTAMFMPFPEHRKGLVAGVCSLAINTASAGQTVQVGLYRLQKLQERLLRLVAGTRVVFSCASTGRLTSALNHDIILSPEGNYYLGFWSSSNVPRLSGASYTHINPLPALSAASTTGLPDTFSLQGTWTTDPRMPLVVYFNKALIGIY